MKLILREQFSLEIPQANQEDKVITGTYMEYTPKLQKMIQEEFKEDTDKAKRGEKLSLKLQKKLKKLNRWEERGNKSEDEIEALENEIESLEDEVSELIDFINESNANNRVFKRRIELQFNAECQDEIRQLCEVAGYKRVFNAVAEDINEKKGNDTKN